MPVKFEMKFARTFTVEINGQFLPVKSYSGGEPVGETADPSTGASQHEEAEIGHLEVESYVLPNATTLTDAAHAVANRGQNERFTIAITHYLGKHVIKRYVYDGCLLTSLDFPTLRYRSREPLTERATFKPEFLDIV